MNRTPRVLSVVGLLLLGLVLAIAAPGCGGEDQVAGAGAPTAGAAPVEVALAVTTTSIPLSYDELSTFESKDPFVPRVVEVAESSGGATTPTTVPGASTTTTVTNTTNPTTQPTTVTTLRPTTTTLAPPLHSLKVVAIEIYSGQPVVTFKVDGVVFQSKREGDIVSSNWGQIKVIDVDPEAKEVVFLHGSEIRVLKVGQEFLK